MHLSVLRAPPSFTRLLVAPILALGLAAGLLSVAPSGARATGPLDGTGPTDEVHARPSTTTGWDISFPQCGGPFPANPAFGIVGVNGGRVFSPNPCLGTGNGPSELAWAGPNAIFYANTGNPGPELSSYWPHGQRFPRECDTDASPGADTRDCAYDYGWNAAAHSYLVAVEAYVSLGWAEADASGTPVANQWWLDVETTNSWRGDVSLNVAALQGAADYLKSVGVASVGFYSTQRQWNHITGGTLVFADHATWVAGGRNLRQARDACEGTGFTGGAIELAQYYANGFDADYRCPPETSA